MMHNPNDTAINERRALVIGPTPPPLGGDTVSTHRLLESIYWKEYGVTPVHVNTSAGDRIRVSGEKLRLSDIARGVRIFLNVLLRLPRTDIVLLWVNSRFLCTAAVPMLAAASFLRRPVIVKFFGTSLPARLRAYSPSWRGRVLRLLGTARYILPQTQLLSDELVSEFMLPAGRVVCLPNYIPEQVLASSPRERRFTGTCVFVGQIKREKGIFEIIEAFADMPDFSCDFFGPILKFDREAFFEAIAGVSNCRHCGAVPPGEMISLLGEYDALLLPTYHEGEGYPAVILEAFAAGLPVVATDWKAIPDLVGDGERGFIVPVRSSGAIRDALCRMRDNDARYTAMSHNALEHARLFTDRTILREILFERIKEIAG